MKELSKDFIKMLHDLLGDEASLLIEALDLPPVTSVRLNKRKPGAEFPEGEPVPWCESGLYLDKRPEFIFDPLLHAGAYYVQDASSMIYETVVSILLNKLKEEGRDINDLDVLDLCAAPGGKTTAMINALQDGCCVVANEYSKKRVAALEENIERWGYPDVQITNKDTSHFAEGGVLYDIVAVDAPCSGEGMMRKEEMARTQWSASLVDQCCSLQKEILRNAYECLKPGGFLIYSTCTFNRLENEENAEFIVRDLDLEPVDLKLPKEWGIREGIGTSLPVYRFMPHVTRGEGLFLAVFRKHTEKETVTIENISKRRKNIPEKKEKKEEIPHVEIDKETAVKYLKGESVVLSPDAPKGLVTLTFKNLPLGPAKNIGSRANNLYPKNRRIKKR